MLALIQVLFDAFCHRDPSRSYLLADGSVLLCARCMGLYAGAFAGAASALTWRAVRWKPAFGPAAIVLLAGIAATPLEVLAEKTGLWEGTRGARLILGAATGTSLACAILLAMGGGAASSGGRRGWLAAVPLFIDGAILPVILAPHRWGLVGTMIAGVLLLLGLLTLLAGPVAYLIFRVRRQIFESPLTEGSSP